MGIGLVYRTTFSTLGMTFSALGAFAAGIMWSLIALIRSPALSPGGLTLSRGERLTPFAGDVCRWSRRRLTSRYGPRSV